MSYVSASPSPASVQDFPESQSDKITWNLGSLRAGESRTITLQAKINTSYDMTYVNSVSITTTTKETNYNNNASSASFTITNG
jgi:hypothetical protein